MSLLKRLQFLEKHELIVGGVISGTSQDSIVSAICTINEASVNLIGYHESSYSSKCRELLQDCLHLKTSQISELNFMIGQEFAKCVSEAANKMGIKLDLVGFHGQTVFHHSGLSKIKSTLQLGIPEYIAEEVGCPVVSDFRYRDIVVDGEGAPLSPWGDLRMFKFNTPFAVLNIGGVANYTFIDRSNGAILGFDCGPGNSLIDRVVRKFNLSKVGYDHNGDIGRRGKIIHEALDFMVNLDNFFSLKPPKSCGFERFGDEFLNRVIANFSDQNPIDLLRTTYEFTLEGIISGLNFIPKVDLIILAGGGCQNSFLVELIKGRTNSQVEISDKYGVPWKARESILMAILAHDFIRGVPTNVPLVTGAYKSTLLGRLVVP